MIEYNWWLIGGLLLWLVPGVIIFVYALFMMGVASKGRALSEPWGWYAATLYGLLWPGLLVKNLWERFVRGGDGN